MTEREPPEGAAPSRQGRSWVIEPKSEGWVFEKTYPTKWKAALALKVWCNGGRVSDYWTAAREAKVERRGKRERTGRSGSDETGVLPEGDREDLVRPDLSWWKQVVDGMRSALGCLLAPVLIFAYIFIPPLLFLGGILAFLLMLFWIRSVNEFVGRALMSAVGGFLAVAIVSYRRTHWYSVNLGYMPRLGPKRPSPSVLFQIVAFAIGAVITWDVTSP